MKRISVLLLLLTLIALSEHPLAADRTWSLYIAASGASSIGMLGRFTNLGMGGNVGIGWRPSRNSREVEIISSMSYDRFANEETNMGNYSFVRAGAGVKLSFGSQQSNQVYFIIDAGPAFVRAESSNGFPPYRGQSHKSTNLYGAGGAGMTFAISRNVSMFTQIELVDILDTLFGDYRFFRLSVGVTL